jgi:hypothetical protein
MDKSHEDYELRFISPVNQEEADGKYDLVFLSGGTGSTSTWTFWSGVSFRAERECASAWRCGACKDLPDTPRFTDLNAEAVQNLVCGIVPE